MTRRTGGADPRPEAPFSRVRQPVPVTMGGSEPLDLPTKGMNCPWDVLPQVELQFCERVLCGWIRQPGNTLSNLGFLIVSFLVVRREGGRSALAAVAWASLLTGLGSAFFHASGSRIGGQLDYAGMFAGSAFMIAFNGCRWFRRPTALAPAAALFAVSLLPFAAHVAIVISHLRWPRAFGAAAGSQHAPAH